MRYLLARLGDSAHENQIFIIFQPVIVAGIHIVVDEHYCMVASHTLYVDGDPVVICLYVRDDSLAYFIRVVLSAVVSVYA